MDVIRWGLFEQLTEGDYQLSGHEEVPSLSEFLQREGSISVSAENLPDLQLTGICSATLARTPIIYSACLSFPVTLLTEQPDKHLVVRVQHDPFTKIYDEELFAPDAGYVPHGLPTSSSHDPSNPVFSVRVSRSSYEKLAPFTRDYIMDTHDLRQRLDARGWLSFNDMIELIFWKEGEEPQGTAPIYVSSILESNYKRELTDKLGEKICSNATGTLYGPAAVAAEMNRRRKASRRRN